MRDGNPLVAVYFAGGEAAVDAWIEEQTEWSAEELVQMLRELAIEIAMSGDNAVDDAEDNEDAVDAEDDEGAGDDDGDGDDDDDDDDDDEDANDDDDDDDESEGNEDEDRGRQITTHAREVLKARADAGLLDTRARHYLATDSNDENLN